MITAFMTIKDMATT